MRSSATSASWTTRYSQNSNLRPRTDQLGPDVGAHPRLTTRGQVWAASAGNELAKANAAIERDKEVIDKATGELRLEENNLEVPKSVVEKWQAALIAAHGPTCEFRRKGRCSANSVRINAMHIYKFVLAGTPRLPSYPS